MQAVYIDDNAVGVQLIVSTGRVARKVVVP